MQGNPILNQLNNLRSNNSNDSSQIQLQPYKDALHQIQNSPNPQTALQNMLMQNPNIQKINQLLKMNNGSLQLVAQMLANQRGVNINDIIKELQQ